MIHNHSKTIAELDKDNTPMEDTFDLDRELESVLAEAPEAVEEQEMQEEQPSMEKTILKMLEEHKDAPSPEKIEQWKKQLGDNAVQVVAFDKDNVFIYTHLTVDKWEKINRLKEAAGQKDAGAADKRMKEAILKTAILWPTIDTQFLSSCRAGLPNTLVDLIMVNSYFLSTQHTLALTAKL